MLKEEKLELDHISETKVELTKFMGNMSEVLPFLYLGSAYNARFAETLTANGITHVLNVASNCPTMEHKGIEMRHVSVSYRYKGEASLTQFDSLFDFIDSAKESGGKVLVHCMRGNSRSVCVVLCYLIARHNKSLEQAYTHVKRRRPRMKPVEAVEQKAMKFEERFYRGDVNPSFRFFY